MEKEKQKIRVFIADDHLPLVDLTVQILEGCPAFQVVGSASSAERTLEQLRSKAIDLLILDIVLRASDETNAKSYGLDLIATLKAIQPEMKILVITGNGPEHEQASLTRKANGFLNKPYTAEELTEAIATVMSGKLFYNAGILEKLQPGVIAVQRGMVDYQERLTADDRKYIFSRLSGMSDSRIAEKLGVKLETIAQRRYRIARRLELDTDIESFLFGVISQQAGLNSNV